MHPLIIKPLPYQPNSCLWFTHLRDLSQPIFLDSAWPYCLTGRYDIISAQPRQSLQENSQSASKQHFFTRLQEQLSQIDGDISNNEKLPFVGGALGYFGYDLARQLEQLPQHATDDLAIPDALVGIYDWALISDHQQHRTLLVAHPEIDVALLHEIQQRLQVVAKNTDHSTVLSPGYFESGFQTLPTEPTLATEQLAAFSNLSKSAYREAFNQIQRYISAGDCYQVNLAQRFSASYSGDPWVIYQQLRQVAAAPYSAYMETDQQAIMSLSPEHFISVNGQNVSSSPIKGTIARGDTTTDDQQLAQKLLHSNKDRAENLMIVDLLRNDLGKHCQPGSIDVNAFCQLQSFNTVHHLVSNINGRLQHGVTASEVLADCFPGGSITGAPKIRAMEIIEELEPHRRSVYCGAMGYIGYNGTMDTSITIRTLLCHQQRVHCWAGGAIIADSNWLSEYHESILKVSKLLYALRSVEYNDG